MMTVQFRERVHRFHDLPAFGLERGEGKLAAFLHAGLDRGCAPASPFPADAATASHSHPNSPPGQRRNRNGMPGRQVGSPRGARLRSRRRRR